MSWARMAASEGAVAAEVLAMVGETDDVTTLVEEAAAVSSLGLDPPTETSTRLRFLGVVEFEASPGDLWEGGLIDFPTGRKLLPFFFLRVTLVPVKESRGRAVESGAIVLAVG